MSQTGKLEAAVAKIGQGGGGDKKLLANVETLAKHVNSVNGQVNEIKKNLSNTLGYGVRETFQFTSCRTKGNVAAGVLCTDCNKGTFVGWWPRR